MRPRTPAFDVPQRPLSQSLAVGRVFAEIGKEDESGPYMFGGIGAVAMGGDGVIYVGENSTFEIRLFDQQGRHLKTVGRRGRGPGEFMYPFSLYHDGDSTLFAIQPGLGVTEFVARGSEIRYRRSFGADVRYSSICTMHGKVFVGIGGDSGVVRELDASRHEVRAFGGPFTTLFYGEPSPGALAMSKRTGPNLLCDQTTGSIYAIRGDQGTIRRYDGDGTLRWETTLPNMKAGFYGTQSNGVYVVAPIDFIWMVLPLGATRLLVDVPRQNFESTRGQSRAPGSFIRPDVEANLSYILDATSGRILSRSASAGLLTALADTLAGERVTDPWPMLRLRTVRSRVP